MSLPIFEQTWRAVRPALPTGRHRWHGPTQPVPHRVGAHRHAIDAPTQEISVADPAEPPADTAGEQDHDDPWQYASEDYVDAPEDTGRPAEGGQ